MEDAVMARAKVIIPLGDGRMPLRVIRCFGPLKASFTLLSKDRENVARASKYCSEFIYSNPENDQALLTQLNSIPQKGFKEILLPITTEGFQFVSRNIDALNARFRIPPISKIENLITASDKWKLYDFARENGLPVLRSVSLSDINGEESPSRSFTIKFPVLVKTRGKEGGDGFKKVDTIKDLVILKDSLSPEQASGYFVQRFVRGKDVSLSVFCENGSIKCYTLWRAIAYGKKRYQIPTCIEFIEDNRVLEIGGKLMRLLKWEGVCDIDFFQDTESGELWLLEINARFWGNLVGCALQGVDFLSLMCRKAIGDEPIEYPRQKYGVYCYPKGIPKALRNRKARRSLLNRPLKSTGVNILLQDIRPEFYKLILKIKRLFNRRTENRNT